MNLSPYIKKLILGEASEFDIFEGFFFFLRMGENFGCGVVCVDDVQTLKPHFCFCFGRLDFYGVFVVIFCSFYVVHFFITDSEHKICIVIKPVPVGVGIAVVFYCIVKISVLKERFSQIIKHFRVGFVKIQGNKQIVFSFSDIVLNQRNSGPANKRVSVRDIDFVGLVIKIFCCVQKSVLIGFVGEFFVIIENFIPQPCKMFCIFRRSVLNNGGFVRICENPG